MQIMKSREVSGSLGKSREVSGSLPLPVVSAQPKEMIWPADRTTTEKVQNEGKKEPKEERRRERAEIPGKKRKARSILPLSTSMDHRSKEDLQQDCLTLAAVRFSQGQSGCVPGSGEHIQLGLFTDREALYRMFQEEGRSHVDSGHYDSAVYLLLWKGDLTGALRMATEKGELTDHLVSMAPMAGYQVWLKTVEAFIKQLCFQEQFLKAASYLLSVHKVYEAVELLMSQQLYREAIALAKARLQPEDPVFRGLYTTWAAVLERDGHYASAAKCYLAADCGFDAAKVMAKKGDVASLRAAARLAAVAGEAGLAHTLSLRCARELTAAQDWLGAQEVLRTQDSLLGHRVTLCASELLFTRLPEADGTKRSGSSNHSWSEPSGLDFLSELTAVWQRELGVSPDDLDRVRSVREQLKATDPPTSAPNIPVNQLLQHVSQDVTLGVLSGLLGDWGAGLEDLLRGVARCFVAGHFPLLFDVCRLLFPEGLDSVGRYREGLGPQEEAGGAGAGGLEAFVSYGRLCQLWWSRGSEGGVGRAGGTSDALQPAHATDTQNPSASRGPDTLPGTETVVLTGPDTLPGTETVVLTGPDTLPGTETVALTGPDFQTETDTVVLTGSDLQTDTETVVLNGSDLQTDADAVVLTGSDLQTVTDTDAVVLTGSDLQTDAEAVVLTRWGRALLSEPHASLQATQRAIAEVQQQIAGLVQQHRLTQAANSPGDGQTETDSSADAQHSHARDSLSSLVALVSEHHKQLAEIPEHTKKYAFPDVLECCLILLHMDRSGSSLPEGLKVEAQALLRRHGAAGSFQKACQRFLH